MLIACGERLAVAGYAVFGIDYEGHGRSEELQEYQGKNKFLYGDSMGGAVCLLLHRRDNSFYDGAILVAPMCKISEKMMPSPMVVNVFSKLEDLIPKWKIVPTKDVIDSAYTDPAKREKIRNNKLIYQDKPRLKTAMEMLRTSTNIENNLDEVTLPFIVIQGNNDIVTDPRMCQTLYEKANSIDKTIKLYTGMCHGLTTGETDENIAIVFADILAWLDDRIFASHISSPFH
ncbi:hypothetical protein VNO78_20744 [Psophocarpus tetragonolobus]|uniref:Serine aminopeptidase S33 domain-containing protein n=1 Tax=Psophocarpus tetragonolobus TaxID=3891 RepID=A0AAN9SAU6_PSOTE